MDGVDPQGDATAWDDLVEYIHWPTGSIGIFSASFKDLTPVLLRLVDGALRLNNAVRQAEDGVLPLDRVTLSTLARELRQDAAYALHVQSLLYLRNWQATGEDTPDKSR